jgi:hypothetical protein
MLLSSIFMKRYSDIVDQARFNLKLGLYRRRAVWILKYDANYAEYSFKHAENLSLIVAFTSPRRGIEAAFSFRITEWRVSFVCYSFSFNNTFAAEFAVMVAVTRLLTRRK